MKTAHKYSLVSAPVHLFDRDPRYINLWKLDLSRPFVEVGPYQVQRSHVYGIDADYQLYTGDILDLFMQVPDVSITIEHTQVRDGPGRGFEIIEITNTDDSLILQIRYVDHCVGHGNACGYNRGPWYKLGEYRGRYGDPYLAYVITFAREARKHYRLGDLLLWYFK